MRTATRQYKFRLVFLWLTQCTHALWHSFLPVLPVWPSTLTLGITMEDRSHDKQRQTNHGSIINNFKKNRTFLVLNNPAVSSELTYKTVCFLHLIKYYPDWHFSTMYFFLPVELYCFTVWWIITVFYPHYPHMLYRACEDILYQTQLCTAHAADLLVISKMMAQSTG